MMHGLPAPNTQGTDGDITKQRPTFSKLVCWIIDLFVGNPSRNLGARQKFKNTYHVATGSRCHAQSMWSRSVPELDRIRPLDYRVESPTLAPDM